MPKRNPIPLGSRSARLQVIGPSERRIDKSGNPSWWCLCKCDCGTEFWLAETSFRTGRTRSCGCLHDEELTNRNTTHGYCGTRTYRIWQAMRSRCRYPSQVGYKNYGGKGITWCERWDSFENFLADMGECPPRLSIHRLDNDKGYEPGNCIWATRKEQARKTSQNSIHTFNGITACVAELCERFGANYRRVKCRLQRGWPIEQAFNLPVAHRRPFELRVQSRL